MRTRVVSQLFYKNQLTHATYFRYNQMFSYGIVSQTVYFNFFFTDVRIYFFNCQPEARSNKLSPIPETSEEDHECSKSSEDEEKSPSLTEQALELKKAMRYMAEICGDQTTSVQTQNTVKRLEKERCVAHKLYIFWF